MSGAGRPVLVVGSFNVKKAAEMTQLLSGLAIPVRSLAEFDGLEPVEEDGNTFAENAQRKALGLARQIDDPHVLGVVADDSGLEIDALDGRPGIHSARYLGENAMDPERVQGILKELGDRAPGRRTARFHCHVVLANRDEILLETHGIVEGRIAFQAAGDYGFGYDPVFVPDGYDRSFAELGAKVKHQISHRAKALREFRECLATWLDEQDREEE